MVQRYKNGKKVAFAEGTCINLTIQWKSFLSFCFYFNMPWLPTNADTLTLYAQFLRITFNATSSITNYICEVKMLHSLTNTPSPAFQAQELKLAFRGLSRLNPHCPKQASPITSHILSEILAQLDLSNLDNMVFWTLCLIAFFTFARKSNLVQSGAKKTQLLKQDVKVGSWGVLITFNWTKTIQFGERKLVIPVVEIPVSVVPSCGI